MKSTKKPETRGNSPRTLCCVCPPAASSAYIRNFGFFFIEIGATCTVPPDPSEWTLKFSNHWNKRTPQLFHCALTTFHQMNQTNEKVINYVYMCFFSCFFSSVLSTFLSSSKGPWCDWVPWLEALMSRYYVLLLLLLLFRCSSTHLSDDNENNDKNYVNKYCTSVWLLTKEQIHYYLLLLEYYYLFSCCNDVSVSVWLRQKLKCHSFLLREYCELSTPALRILKPSKISNDLN